MRRIFWLALGLGAGATAAVLAARWMRRQTEKVAPANIGRQVSQGATDLRQLVAAAIDAGRQAAADREAEIRAEMDAS